LSRKVERPELKDFASYLLVKKRLSPRTVQDSVQAAKRLLKQSNYVVSADTLEEYLKDYVDGSPSTYNGQLVRLRRFMDYLDMSELIEEYTAAPVPLTYNELPTTRQVARGFRAQRTPERKAYYIFTATTGLRRGEILDLERNKVDTRLRSVIPEHYTPTKRSGITFYSEEAEPYVRPYIEGCPGDLFTLSDRENRKVWNDASKAARPQNYVGQALHRCRDSEVKEDLRRGGFENPGVARCGSSGHDRAILLLYTIYQFYSLY